MSTTGESLNTNTLSMGSGNWVLIYGYTTHQQYKKLLKQFSSYGRVLNHKKPSTLNDDKAENPQNWLALQYESRLEAEKALCHDHFELSDTGVFCGVKRLNDNDPLLLQGDDHANSLKYLTGSATLHEVENDDDDGEQTRPNESIGQSVCERFFRWMLSID